MVCATIKSDIDNICIGDLNRKITLQYPVAVKRNAPRTNTPSADATTFTTIATVWAMVKTRNTAFFRGGVNTETSPTTEFYIRYNSSLNLEQLTYIEYNSKKYRVTNAPENIGLQNKFWKITSVERGDSSLNANLR